MTNGAVVAGNGRGHGSVVRRRDGGVEVKNDDQSKKFGRKHIGFEGGVKKKEFFCDGVEGNLDDLEFIKEEKWERNAMWWGKHICQIPVKSGRTE